MPRKLKCKGCGQKTGVLNNTLVICDKCTNPNSMKLVPKTAAMERYVLTSADLQGVQCAYGWQNGPTNITSTLYLIDDVEKIAINKYGSREDAIKKIKERDNKRHDVAKRKSDVKDIRRKELNKYLVSLGVGGVREDSVMCQQYIEMGNQSGYTPQLIGDAYLEMNFFYTHTDYQTRLKAVRNEFRTAVGRSFEETEVSDETKERCLYDYVKQNYLNHHKMIDELPPSLKDIALKISDELYKNPSYKLPTIEDELNA
jgi:hypothetical protein